MISMALTPFAPVMKFIKSFVREVKLIVLKEGLLTFILRCDYDVYASPGSPKYMYVHVDIHMCLKNLPLPRELATLDLPLHTDL